MQDNIISAENYMLDESNIQNVIVGSSLARRLIMDSLPEYFNLSLGGLSVYDGLNVVRSGRNLPDRLYVEINALIRQENTTFNGIVSSKPLNTAKMYIPALRRDKQPLSALIDLAVVPVVKAYFGGRKPVSNPEQLKNKGINEDLFRQMVQIEIKKNMQPLDSLYLEDQICLLKDHVKYLQTKGVEVIFFEMPVNIELANLRRNQQIRQAVVSNFPDEAFIGIPADLEPYHTTDGLHLSRDEALLYTAYFVSMAEKNSRD